MKLIFVEKVYWMFMVKGIVYVMLFSFINEMFNFRISNEVGKPIINKYLLLSITETGLCIYHLVTCSKLSKIVREEDSSLALEISVFYGFIFYNRKGIDYGKWRCTDECW